MSNWRRYILLVVVALVFMLPLLWIVLSSLKPQAELFTFPLSFLPDEPTLENYAKALSQRRFVTYFGNSTFVAVTATVLTVIINTMAGYALSKYIFPGRDMIFFVMIATLMIPLQVIMVPIFLLLKNVGLLNTLWGVIIPPAATPTGIFLTRQYMLAIPNSLIESARIDGGGEWFIFRSIIIPLATPVIATLIIFSFMWRWNDFLWPFIVISRPELSTLQLALANFVGQYQIQWSSLLAMTVISMLPMVAVFLAFQRYFIKGITSGSVKY
jgi:alpha-1,4-digalacturonate transport system permease protein